MISILHISGLYINFRFVLHGIWAIDQKEEDMSFEISRKEHSIQLTNDDDSNIFQNLTEKTNPTEQFNELLIASIDESLSLL